MCYSTSGFYVTYLKVLIGQKLAETFFSNKETWKLSFPAQFQVQSLKVF